MMQSHLPDANVVASVDHVDELVSGATTALELITDRLIALPPVPACDESVLIGWRNLHSQTSRICKEHNFYSGLHTQNGNPPP